MNAATIRRMLLREKLDPNSDFGRLARWVGSLPDNVTNMEQCKLYSRFGTPREFGKDMLKVIPEVSVIEARQAIEKYVREWRNTE